MVFEPPAGNAADDARQEPHLVVLDADEHQHVLVATLCEEINAEPRELPGIRPLAGSTDTAYPWRR